MYVELNVLTKSWLLCYTYDTNVNIIENSDVHSDVLERSLDMHFAKYKNLMIMCYPNAPLKLMIETVIRIQNSLYVLICYYLTDEKVFTIHLL